MSLLGLDVKNIHRVQHLPQITELVQPEGVIQANLTHALEMQAPRKKGVSKFLPSTATPIKHSNRQACRTCLHHSLPLVHPVGSDPGDDNMQVLQRRAVTELLESFVGYRTAPVDLDASDLFCKHGVLCQAAVHLTRAAEVESVSARLVTDLPYKRHCGRVFTHLL